MNREQNPFFDFMMSRSIDQEKMQVVLLENFKLQQQGAFNKEAYEKSCLDMMSLVKDEYKEEVQNIFNNFGKGHISK